MFGRRLGRLGLGLGLILLVLVGQVLIPRTFGATQVVEESPDIGVGTLVELPLRLATPEGSFLDEVFSFDILNQHTRLEYAITSFCEKHNIRSGQCRVLYRAADQQVKERKDLYYRRVKREPRESRVSRRRYPAAILDDLHHAIDHIPPFVSHVESVVKHLQQLVQGLRRIHLGVLRVVFLHCPLYDIDQWQSLSAALASIDSSTLPLYSHATVVLHYGDVPIPSEMTLRHADITFLHVQNSTIHTQSTSLYIIHRIFQQVKDSPEAVHVLHLNLFTPFIPTTPQPLTDLQQLLLYFLVHQHSKSYHLLLSKEFDVVAVGYDGFERGMYGNSWWTTAAYLSSLPVIAELRGKEGQWILRASETRVHMLHQIHHLVDVDDLDLSYPSFCYIHSPPTVNQSGVDFTTWKNQCTNVTVNNASDSSLRAIYDALHNDGRTAMNHSTHHPDSTMRTNCAQCRSIHLKYELN